MVQAPTDRAAAVKKICKAVGVKFISLDLCRGAYDIVVVAESDSYDRVLGLKMAVAASGAVSEFHILERWIRRPRWSTPELQRRCTRQPARLAAQEAWACEPALWFQVAAP